MPQPLSESGEVLPEVEQPLTAHNLETTLTHVLRKLFGSSAPSDGSIVYADNKEHYDAGALDPTVEPDPIPVNMVSSTPVMTVLRGTANWTGDKTLVRTQVPQQIVGSIPYRRSVILVHQGANNIAIGPSTAIRFGGIGNTGSFELRPGDSMAIDTRGEIWAIADPASTGETIGIIQLIEEGTN